MMWTEISQPYIKDVIHNWQSCLYFNTDNIKVNIRELSMSNCYCCLYIYISFNILPAKPDSEIHPLRLHVQQTHCTKLIFIYTEKDICFICNDQLYGNLFTSKIHKQLLFSTVWLVHSLTQWVENVMWHQELLEADTMDSCEIEEHYGQRYWNWSWQHLTCKWPAKTDNNRLMSVRERPDQW